jgi:hypothetical protein
MFRLLDVTGDTASLIIGFCAGFLVAAVYALKAEWIRDYLLNWTGNAHGTSSAAYRLSRWFVSNAFYVVGFRIVAGIVAACMLAAVIYLIVMGETRL